MAKKILLTVMSLCLCLATVAHATDRAKLYMGEVERDREAIFYEIFDMRFAVNGVAMNMEPSLEKSPMSIDYRIATRALDGEKISMPAHVGANMWLLQNAIVDMWNRKIEKCGNEWALKYDGDTVGVVQWDEKGGVLTRIYAASIRTGSEDQRVKAGYSVFMALRALYIEEDLMMDAWEKIKTGENSKRTFSDDVRTLTFERKAYKNGELWELTVTPIK